MTDQQLIDLIERVPPDELSSDEIAELRRRLHDSPALRDALSGHLRLEQYLGDSLGGVQVSVDKILLAAAALAPAWWRPFSGWRGFGLGALLVVIAASTAVLTLALRRPPHGDARPLADRLAPAPADPGPPGPEAGVADDRQASTTNADEPSRTPPVERVAMRPVIAAPDDPLEEDDSSPSDPPADRRRELEAERFVRGNVRVDADDNGAGIGVIASGPESPSFAEYQWMLAAAGQYELEVRYASREPRPFRAAMNGQVIEVAGQRTGGTRPDWQHWFTVGQFTLPAGASTLRLESEGPLPHLDKLALVELRPAAVPDAPWNEGLDVSAAPLPFEAACFGDFDPRQAAPPPGELAQWLAPVAGEPIHLQDRPGQSAVFHGLAQLRAPWPSDATLRLSLYGQHGFQLHFWYGRLGVTIRYYQDPHPCWAAYSTTRTNNGPRPATFALVGTDSGRYRRSACGSVEVRHAAGTLVMTRGDVRLLTAALERAPAEVYFEGPALVRGLAMYRSSGPPPEENTRPVVLRSDSPAAMAWLTDLPAGAGLEKLPDGAIELAGRMTPSLAWAAVPLGQPGLYEVICEVESPAPGTGVYLGDSRGRPLYRIGFFRDTATGWTSFGHAIAGDARMESRDDIQERPAPYVSRRAWLRLVLGCGTLKCWTSGDGVHWGQALDPRTMPDGSRPYSHLGVYCLPGEAPRSIRLLRLEVRELSAITTLAAGPLRESALSLADDPEMDLASWLASVLAGQPSDADADAWRRSCAVQTLVAGPPSPLAHEILLRLAAEGTALAGSIDDCLRLIEETALVADAWSDGQQGVAARIQALYERLGRPASGPLPLDGGGQGGGDNAHSDRPAFSAVGRALMTAPIWTSEEVDAVPAGLVRHELLDLAYRDEWDAAARLSRQVLFWSRPCDPDRRLPSSRDSAARLAAWVEARAGESATAPRQAAGTIPAVWRHPLIEDLGKEAFNILAEFEAAVAAGEYHDACQVLSTAETDRALGLLPDRGDARLLVSLACAVGLAFGDHPELAQVMRDQFGPVGLMRVRQAAETGDAVALRAATVQFFGTEAAGEAHVWIGDRALARGDPTRALAAYDQAIACLPESQHRDVLARRRLAAATLGRDWGTPPVDAVEFEDGRVGPDEFEALVAQRRSAHASSSPPVPPTSRTTDPLAPARYGVRAWSRFDIHAAGADPAVRPVSAVISERTLFLADAVQVTAFDLATGAVRWSAGSPPPEGAPIDPPSIMVKPLLLGDRLFVRRMAGQGIELACLAAADGAILWTSRTGGLASDPIWLHDKLLALCITFEPDGAGLVQLTEFDRATGDARSQAPLARVRLDGRPISCQVTTADDTLIATVAGSVLCCDPLGGLQWIRRQEWLPPSQDDAAAGQLHQPPQEREGSIYVSQPGIRAVECLDVASGRLEWRHVAPDVQSLVGVAQDRLIVRTDIGLVALDAATGALMWTHAAEELLLAVGADEQVFYARRERSPNGLCTPRLVWLDPVTGRERATSPLTALADSLPTLGPLLRDGDRWLACFSRAAQQASGELVELTAAGAPYPPADAPSALDAWVAPDDLAARQAVAAVLPGWTLLASGTGLSTGWQTTVAADADAVATLPLSPRSPARLALPLRIPDGATARLVLRVAHEPRRRWRLEVRAAGECVLDKVVSGDTATDGWLQAEVDLARYAGRSIWLTVAAHQAEDPGALAFWNRLEVVQDVR